MGLSGRIESFTTGNLGISMDKTKAIGMHKETKANFGKSSKLEGKALLVYS